jgi:hypothetical protein
MEAAVSGGSMRAEGVLLLMQISPLAVVSADAKAAESNPFPAGGVDDGLAALDRGGPGLGVAKCSLPR